jgi:predicted ATPase
MDLPVREFSASGYRSLERIAYPMSRLDVFVGANGAGKSNLYRGLELLRASAENTLGAQLAAEGLSASMWAGRRRRDQPAEMTFAVTLDAPDRTDATLRYEVTAGFPAPTMAAFETEPQIKAETLIYAAGQRRVRLAERNGPAVMARGADGRPSAVDLDLLPSETLLGRLDEPSHYPMLDQVRRTLLGWRFYHHLRTDAGSPLRRPAVAVATASLASDGGDLAAVLATLAHIRGDTVALDQVVAQAFPGARLDIPYPERTASFGVLFPDFPKRVFEASELSDGTLKFLALAGALLAYRLPPFIALNEPESSLHPDLMEPLARLVTLAAERTQVWLVTHSERLAAAIAKDGAGQVRTVVKQEGATTIEGLTLFGTFRDDD